MPRDFRLQLARQYSHQSSCCQEAATPFAFLISKKCAAQISVDENQTLLISLKKHWMLFEKKKVHRQKHFGTKIQKKTSAENAAICRLDRKRAFAMKTNRNELRLSKHASDFLNYFHAFVVVSSPVVSCFLAASSFDSSWLIRVRALPAILCSGSIATTCLKHSKAASWFWR